jgi:hypothetical protein
VQRPRAAVREDHEVARIEPPADHHPLEQVGHLGVDDLDDAERGVGQRQPQRVGDAADRRLREVQAGTDLVLARAEHADVDRRHQRAVRDSCGHFVLFLSRWCADPFRRSQQLEVRLATGACASCHGGGRHQLSARM